MENDATDMNISKKVRQCSSFTCCVSHASTSWQQQRYLQRPVVFGTLIRITTFSSCPSQYNMHVLPSLFTSDCTNEDRSLNIRNTTRQQSPLVLIEALKLISRTNRFSFPKKSRFRNSFCSLYLISACFYNARPC